MIEKIVLDYLTEQLSVPVHVMQPEDAPDSYVLLEKTSGGESDQVPKATIAIQSYGATLYQASSLNEEVKTAMKGIVSLDTIGRCHLDSDYNFTDLVRRRPRYQAVFSLRYY